MANLRLVPAASTPEYALSKTGEYVVEVEDLTRLPWGEPAYDDWIALPLGPPCPNCGGTYFGTVNPRGYLLIRSCHGDHDRPSCGARFRTGDPEEQKLTALDVIGRALFGYRQRFAIRRATAQERATGVVGGEYTAPLYDGRLLLCNGCNPEHSPFCAQGVLRQNATRSGPRASPRVSPLSGERANQKDRDVR